MNIKCNHFKKSFFFIFFSCIAFSMFAQTVPDSEIKKNITEIINPLQKLVQLEPKAFEYNTEKYKHLKLQHGKKFGFMSDNMWQVFPELVTTKHSSYIFGKNVYRDMKIKTIDQTSLIPVLVAAIKEQQAEIKELKKEVEELKAAKITVPN